MPRRAPIARHPNGKIDGPKLAKRIHELRLEGLTLPQIAQYLGLPIHNIHSHMRVPEEWARTERLVRVTVLAAELRRLPSALRSAITTLDLPSTTYGRHIMVTEQVAQQIRDYFDGKIDPATARTWWTIAQVARALHRCEDTVRKGINSGAEPYCRIRRARVAGAVGNSWRYDPFSVKTLTANLPVRPVTPPRGSLTSREVAEILGLRPETVNAWAARSKDSPARRTQYNILYWPLDELVVWLSGRPMPHMRSYARTLRQQVAA